MIPLGIDHTDNRDSTSTILHLINPEDGEIYTADVDPAELFFNMVENTFDVDAPPDPDEELGLLEEWIIRLEAIHKSRLATNRKA